MDPIDYWPLFGLRITTPRLELRVPTDDDIGSLIAVARAGIHEPSTMPFSTPWTDTPSPRFEREAAQHFWAARSTHTVDEWNLILAVVLDGTVVGVQGLSAKRFPVLRTAETGSWLGRDHQGRGLGTEMRFAVLHLAFEDLGARAVTSGAYLDNLASQRVSEATGYERNGTMDSLRRGRRAEQIRYRITVERWRAGGPDFDIAVTGLDRCRDLFEPEPEPEPGERPDAAPS